MCLKIFAEMEEDFEQKVKPVNDDDLNEYAMLPKPYFHLADFNQNSPPPYGRLFGCTLNVL